MKKAQIKYAPYAEFFNIFSIDEKEYQELYVIFKKNVLYEHRKQYYTKNKHNELERNKKYYLNNKIKFKYNSAYRHKYHKKRVIEDIKYKLLRRLRTRLYYAMNGYTKNKTTKKLLGCNLDELKQHLEKQFKPGMSWDNYGYNGWHIDHIIPCASFDLTKPEEQARCFHYSNLQPLWADENIEKSSKYEGKDYKFNYLTQNREKKVGSA